MLRNSWSVGRQPEEVLHTRGTVAQGGGFRWTIAETAGAEQSDSAMAEIIDMLLLILPAGCR